MGYVAAKGGTQAILNAEKLVQFFRLRGESDPVTVTQIRDQMRLAVDRAMSEGGLYDRELAALALKQGEGDALEASFLLRAYRTTLPRLATSLPMSGVEMRCWRRISASFKDIPGGQLLGPTRDYHVRILDYLLLNETADDTRAALATFQQLVDAQEESDELGIFPKVADAMRASGVLEMPSEDPAEEPLDLTRRALTFPAPRSARLQTLACAETGSITTMAYSTTRGYGDIHPTIGELRVGMLPVSVPHPLTGEPVCIGEIEATECEVVSKIHTGDHARTNENAEPPKFTLGYGFSFGHCEVRTISMAILDRVLTSVRQGTLAGEKGPATDEEFVLLHCDGIESSGFTAHYKLPHYVTFEADLNVLDRAQTHQSAQFAAEAERRQEAAQQFLATMHNPPSIDEVPHE